MKKVGEPAVPPTKSFLQCSSALAHRALLVQLEHSGHKNWFQSGERWCVKFNSGLKRHQQLSETATCHYVVLSKDTNKLSRHQRHKQVVFIDDDFFPLWTSWVCSLCWLLVSLSEVTTVRNVTWLQFNKCYTCRVSLRVLISGGGATQTSAWWFPLTHQHLIVSDCLYFSRVCHEDLLLWLITAKWTNDVINHLLSWFRQNLKNLYYDSLNNQHSLNVWSMNCQAGT